mgnify:CR=1 FL=1
MQAHLGAPLMALATTPYPFQRSDAGRAESKRPRQQNDCTVRAVALARGLPYDQAYDLLMSAGRKASRKFSVTAFLKAKPWAEWVSLPAVKGQRRMNPATFHKRFPTGTYICKAANHVFAVIEGMVFDTDLPRPDSCIYGAWAIRPEA